MGNPVRITKINSQNAQMVGGPVTIRKTTPPVGQIHRPKPTNQTPSQQPPPLQSGQNGPPRSSNPMKVGNLSLRENIT